MYLAIDSTARPTSRYRWVILAMTAVTGFIAMGFQSTGLSAMFSEIADSLGLDLIQIGLVWGVGTVMGIFTSVIGGSMIDYFGTRRSLVTLCFLTGITGAMRGFAVDFWSLFLFSFLFGIVQPVLPLNLVKLNRQWFSQQQLGLANGIMSAGFALGLMLGSRLSATVLSPLLGGWRVVLIVLGILVFIVGIFWFIIHPPMERSNNQRPTIRSILANLRFVAQFRNLWLYSMATFGVLGLMRGLVGYVPTYLRDIGWAEADADTAITTFFFASLIGVVPLSYLSDRLQNRRIVLIVGTIAMSIGTAMMYFVSDSYWGVVTAMLIAGFFFDAFMSLKNAAITEIKGLEIAMLGSALGFAGMFRNGASTVMPSIGNTLSKFGLNTPFLFWAVSGLLATISLAMIHSQKQKR